MSFKNLITDPLNKKKVKELETSLRYAEVDLKKKSAAINSLLDNAQKTETEFKNTLDTVNNQKATISAMNEELERRYFVNSQLEAQLCQAKEKATANEKVVPSLKKATRSNKGKISDTEMIKTCQEHFGRDYRLSSFKKMKAVFDWIETFLATARANDLDVVWQDLFTQQCWESAKGKKRTKYSPHAAFRKIVNVKKKL